MKQKIINSQFKKICDPLLHFHILQILAVDIIILAVNKNNAHTRLLQANAYYKSTGFASVAHDKETTSLLQSCMEIVTKLIQGCNNVVIQFHKVVTNMLQPYNFHMGGNAVLAVHYIVKAV